MAKDERTPKQGDIVTVTGPMFNGSTRHAAIVTAVHGDSMVNLTVFPDMNGTYELGSVYKEGTAPAAASGPMWRWPT